MKLPNKWYDVLKWVSLILCHACGTLYLTLSKIWGLPYGAEVEGTFAAIGLFIGALIGVSTINYNKGQNNGKEKDGV